MEILGHQIEKIAGFCKPLSGHILKIRWPQTISYQELSRRTGQRRLDIDIRKRKWQWIGHTLRKPNDDIAKQSFDWNPQGSRRVGRPRTTWKSTVRSQANSQRKTWPVKGLQ
ncbi:uncharacterized protein LOC129940830 [Eupeodes corollae]|uniref:uncharacterized protein LOC129940830 n=1 Tax=Eupeodes corollae TaxID=290404 RepID=UPI00248FEE85|nr:uncharacterized protein LOC129940830 [Eupeodes corollae]